MKLAGRDKELAVVREHLRTGRNLAIWGTAGVGKTALVSEAIAGRPAVLYCAGTSTVKTACESLLAALGLTVRNADNIERKRAILKATRGKDCCFVLDHVGHVTPKLLSLLETIHDSHPMIVVTRSLAWSATGHLKMILWDFDQLELTNLHQADARRFMEAEASRLALKVPNRPQFMRELWRLSRGNPRLIVELYEQVAKGRYVFGGHLSTQLLDLDRRIRNLRVG
jgi:NADPH:quinone reductase-like Zn-dependent oxidoreductase